MLTGAWWIWLVVVVVLVIGTALFLLRLRDALRRMRDQLSQALHDQTLRLDQRCDHLQQQIAALEQRQKLHLMQLQLIQLQASGQLTAERCRDLQRSIESLAGEFSADRAVGGASDGATTAAAELVPLRPLAEVETRLDEDTPLHSISA